MHAEDYINQIPEYVIDHYKMVKLDTGETRIFTEWDFHTCTNYEWIWLHALIWDGKEVKHVRLDDTFPIYNDWNNPDHPDYNDDANLSGNRYYGTKEGIWEVSSQQPLDAYASYDEGINAIHNSKWGDGTDIIEPILEAYSNAMVECWAEKEDTEESSMKNSDWIRSDTESFE